MTKSEPLVYNTILIGQSIKRDPTAEIAEDSKSLILSHKDSIMDFKIEIDSQHPDGAHLFNEICLSGSYTKKVFSPLLTGRAQGT